MPRRQKDRAIEVLEYFEAVPLPGAEVTLALAKETVRRRQIAEAPMRASSEKRSHKKKVAEPVAEEAQG